LFFFKWIKASNNFTNDERIFTEKLLSYWINFITHDDPNYKQPQDQIFWQAYIKKTGYMRANEKMKRGNFLLMKNDEIKMASDFSSHKCKFWNYIKNKCMKISSEINLFVLFIIYTKIKNLIHGWWESKENLNIKILW